MRQESRDPKTTALVPDPLPTLANSIREAHIACLEAAQNSVEHARRCGELLIQAKDQVPYGKWTAWIEANCGFADRTARAYMRLARRLPKLNEAERQRVAVLSLRDVFKAIAAGESQQNSSEGREETIYISATEPQRISEVQAAPEAAEGDAATVTELADEGTRHEPEATDIQSTSAEDERIDIEVMNLIDALKRLFPMMTVEVRREVYPELVDITSELADSIHRQGGKVDAEPLTKYQIERFKASLLAAKPREQDAVVKQLEEGTGIAVRREIERLAVLRTAHMIVHSPGGGRVRCAICRGAKGRGRRGGCAIKGCTHRVRKYTVEESLKWLSDVQALIYSRPL